MMNNKIIILLGPTGVGKTGASIHLAEKLNTEIISADSMQIYRHMNIGTAKPSREERAIIKHHMIDIANPCESFNTGKYIAMVTPIIENLHKQGKIPIIVGGTGLYIKAMTRGIFSGPSADWHLREELFSIEKQEKGSLFNYLKDVDPEAAKNIMPNDIRRIIRALEVCLKSKSLISEMQKKFTEPLPYDFVKIGITRERKELYRLIEERVDLMIQNGLNAEVKKILQLNPDKTPLQAIGYKEISVYLQGHISIEEAVRLIKRNTKRYAKRQFTWFRKEEDINWLDVTGIFENEEIFLQVYTFLKHLLSFCEEPKG